MVDMGGLDNLIANTAYLQARKSSEADSRELQRRRRSLVLPTLQSCEPLRQALPHDFHSLCEQQPIGRRLFAAFLATVPSYAQTAAFLEEVRAWELAEEGPPRARMLQVLLDSCAATCSATCKDTCNATRKDTCNSSCPATCAAVPQPFLSPALATQCRAPNTEQEQGVLVTLAKEEAMAFLQDQPFQDFLGSPFYNRFLQWKAFERQPVSDKYFNEFRVLGKGGFGEVSGTSQVQGGHGKTKAVLC